MRSLIVFWFLGHSATFILATTYILYTRFFPWGARTYAKAFYGTILSYGIILYKAHGVPQISRAYLERVMMDENTQYLILALIWLTSKPVWIVLIPFATFSLFHSLNYTRSELLPKLFPPSSALHATISQRVAPAILAFSQNYQGRSLRLIAYVEVWGILPYLIISVFIGGVSLLTPFIYVHFLRFRFFFSPLTREAFADLKARADTYLLAPTTPAWVSASYKKVIELIIKYGDVQAQPQPPTSQPQPAAQR
ncbi:hypothetical protein HK101_004274 [Irineochytrium annulatum]|nr:hypothetical protein HK101_004274 [Irineochytrium annulatum]